VYGKNNNFGHPNSDVISRLTSIGVKIYRTDADGGIRIVVYKNGKIEINTQIKVNPRK
jgi:beta-lactamase superfamily II metal-dependent hydrolase